MADPDNEDGTACTQAAADNTTIQGAINSVGPNSIIYVCGGTYNEEVVVNQTNVTLVGQDPVNRGDDLAPTITSTGTSLNVTADEVTIVGENTTKGFVVNQSATGVEIDTGVSNTTVRDLTVTGTATDGVVINDAADGVLINDSDFEGISGDGVTASSSTASASGVFIKDNRFNVSGTAISLNNLGTSDFVDESDIDFSGNEIDTSKIDNAIANNTITGESSTSAISIGADGATTRNTTVANNTDISGSFSNNVIEFTAGSSAGLEAIQVAGNEIAPNSSTSGDGLVIDTTGATVSDITLIGNNASGFAGGAGIGLAVRIDGGTTNGVDVKKNDLSDNDVGFELSVANTASGDVTNLAVANVSATNSGTAAAELSLTDGTIDDLTVTDSALNDSASPLAVAGTGTSSIASFTLSTSDLSNNVNGLDLTADSALSFGSVTIDEVTLEGSGGTALLLLADGGSFGDVTVQDAAINGTSIATGLNATAANGGSFTGLTVDTVNATTSGTGTGLTVTADGGDFGSLSLNGTEANGVGTAVSVAATNGGTIASPEVTNLTAASASEGLAITADNGSMSTPTVDTADLSGTGHAVNLTASAGSTLDNVHVESVLANDTQNAAATLVLDNGGMSNVTVTDSGLNGSNGPGLTVESTGTSTLSDLNVTEVDLSNNAEGVTLAAENGLDISGATFDSVLLENSGSTALALRAQGQTLSDVTVENAGLNQTGTALDVEAGTGGSISGVTLETVNATSSTAGADGLSIHAAGGDIGGVSINETDVSSLATAVNLTVTNGGSIASPSITNIDGSGSTTGLNVSVRDASSTISAPTVDTADLQNSGQAIVLDAENESITDAHFESILANESTNGAFAIELADGTVSNLTVTGSGLNDSTNGAGFAVTASGTSTLSDLNLTEVDLSNNAEGVELATSTGFDISGVRFDTVTFENSGDTALTLLADGSALSDVTIQDAGLNETSQALVAQARGSNIDGLTIDTVDATNSTSTAAEGLSVLADGGTVSGLSINGTDVSNLTTGINLTATNGGAISQPSITEFDASNSGTGLDITVEGTNSAIDAPTVKTADLSDTGQAVDLTVNGTSMSDAYFEEVLANGTDSGAFTLSLDDGDVSNLTVTGSGLNESMNGAGFAVDATGDSSISGLNITEVDLSNNADGFALAASGNFDITDVRLDTALLENSGTTALTLSADGANLTNVTVQDAGLNETSQALDARAVNSGNIDNLTVDTVDATNSTSTAAEGLSVLADGGTVSDLSINGTDVSDLATGINLTATNGGAIPEPSLTEFDASNSGTGLDITAEGTNSAIDAPTVDTTDLSDTGQAVDLTVNGTSMSDAYFEAVLANGTDTGAFAVTLDNGDLSNLTVTGSGLNESTNGAGFAVDATGDSSISGLNFTTVDLSNNADSFALAASGNFDITDVRLDTVLLENSGATALTLTADGANLTNVTVQDAGLNETSQALDARAVNGGNIDNLTVDTVDARNSTSTTAEGLSVHADGGTVSELSINGTEVSDLATGINLTATNGGAIPEPSVTQFLAQNSTTGLDITAEGTNSAINAPMVKTADLSDTGQGVSVTVNGTSMSDAYFEEVLANGTDTGAFALTVDNGDVANLTVTGSGLNESTNGAGFAVDATGDSSISGLNITEVDLSNNADGFALAASGNFDITDVRLDTVLLENSGATALTLTADGANLTNVTVQDAGLNETSHALDARAVNGGNITNLTVDTVDARNSTSTAAEGLSVLADGGTISGLSINGTEVSDLATGINLTATNGGAIPEPSVTQFLAQNSTTGLAISASGTGSTISAPTVDTADLRNTTQGVTLDVTNAALTDAHLETVLMNGTQTGALAVSVADGTLSNLTVTGSGLNDSAGAGIAVIATGASTVTGLNVTENDVSGNANGLSVVASDSSSVDDLRFDTALFGQSTETAAALHADGGTVEDVVFRTTGLNESATGLVLEASGSGTLSNVTVNESLIGDNTVGVRSTANQTSTVDNLTFDGVLVARNDQHGMNVTATDSATIQDVEARTLALNDTASGPAATFESAGDANITGVTFVETLVQNNTDGGVAFRAGGTSAITDLNLTTGLVRDNGAFGVQLNGTGGTVSEVELSQIALNGTTGTGLEVTADTGTVRNVTLSEVLANGNDVGASLDANGATVEDIEASTVLLVDNRVGLEIGSGAASDYANVTVTQSLIRNNADAGVLVASAVSTNLTAADIDLSRNFIRGNGIGINNENSGTIIEATQNYWGASTGPSSAATDGSGPLADPIAGVLADGGGDSVTGSNGVANVNFAPAIGGKNTCTDSQLIDPVPNQQFEFTVEGQSFETDVGSDTFSVDIEGETVSGDLTDFTGLCVWERSPLPLRTTGATAATSIQNLQLAFRTDAGDVDANRDRINVHQQGQTVGVQFQSALDADTSRFANEEAQVVVARVTDNQSQALDFEVNQTTGDATVGADAIEVTDITNVTLDSNGNVETQFTPNHDGAYVVLVATTKTGGFTTENGSLTTNALDTDAVIAGIETVSVQNRSSTATPDRTTVPQGGEVTFQLDSNFAQGPVDHALVLYDEEAFTNTLLIVGTDGELSGNSLDNLSVQNGQINATAIRDGTEETIVLQADGPITDLGNNASIAGNISSIDSDTAFIQDGTPSGTVTLQVGENFSAGTYRFVHTASTNDGAFSTDDGTVEVAEVDISVTSASLNTTQIETGGAVEATATVENVGDVQRTLPLELTVDGTVVATKDATVGAGQTKQVTFTRTFNDNGTFDIAINGVSAGQLNVVEPVEEPTGPGGGGGGGGGGDLPTPNPSDPDEEIPIPGRIAPDNPNRVDYVVSGGNATGTLIFELPETDETRAAGTRFTRITARSISATGYEVSITTTRNAPASVPPLDDGRSALLYADIQYTTSSSTFSRSSFEFQVTNERLGNADPRDIALYRYDESAGEWESFPTEVVERADGVTRFRSEANGFSVYAIGQQDSDVQVTEASLSDSEIQAGDSVDVEATVENQGSGTGTRMLELRVDGEVAATQEVTLESGETTTVTFTEVFDEAGTYDIAVDDVDAGTLTVTEPADTGTETETATEGPGDTDDGFGTLVYVIPVLILLLALIAGVYLYRREA